MWIKRKKRHLCDAGIAIEVISNQPEVVSDLAPEPVSVATSFLLRCRIIIGENKLQEKVGDILMDEPLYMC